MEMKSQSLDQPRFGNSEHTLEANLTKRCESIACHSSHTQRETKDSYDASCFVLPRYGLQKESYLNTVAHVYYSLAHIYAFPIDFLRKNGWFISRPSSCLPHPSHEVVLECIGPFHQTYQPWAFDPLLPEK